MKLLTVLEKPTLKTVKIGETTRPMIEVRLSMPYTSDAWAYVGAHAGEALNATFEPAQRDMFDPETGEVLVGRAMDELSRRINSGELDKDGTTVRVQKARR